MASAVNLDLDAVRTFVLGFELGSFARAAERLGRSQSAVSTELRRLEAQIGQPLVRRAGRGLAPTDAGRDLLHEARRLLDLNDAIVERLRGTHLTGRIRAGLTQDLADAFLPTVLGRFALAHPEVRVDVAIDRSGGLSNSVTRGDLDIAIGWGAMAGPFTSETLAEIPMVWLGTPTFADLLARGGSEHLPLALLDPPCVFRDAAIAALEAAGVRWRIAVSSPSVSGLIAATMAGLAVTARTHISLPANARLLGRIDGNLPVLPSVPLTLIAQETPSSGVVAALANAIRAHAAAT